jgi:8-oxo-dGTP pyrophosphatase MutT (NUDIX family)
METCRHIIGVALILKKDGRLLLYQRNIKGKIGFGMFALLGGTVENHETVKQTACREAEEELGIKIAENDLSILHIFRHKEKYDEKQMKFFSC